MLYSYPTAPKEGCTSLSSATLPPATAGVYWWILDGLYLAPPPGRRDYNHPKNHSAAHSMPLFRAYLLVFFTLIYWHLLLCGKPSRQSCQAIISHSNSADWPVNREAVLLLDDSASSSLLASALSTAPKCPYMTLAFCFVFCLRPEILQVCNHANFIADFLF